MPKKASGDLSREGEPKQLGEDRNKQLAYKAPTVDDDHEKPRSSVDVHYLGCWKAASFLGRIYACGEGPGHRSSAC